MKTFKNCYGEVVSDKRSYYIQRSNVDPEVDFIPEGDDINLHETTYHDAVRQAKQYSKSCKAVNLCCEQWLDNPSVYCGPETIWRERYENGVKRWRRSE